MDRKYIDDHHVVARYLADQLPDTEREAFEAWYLEHPEVVQEMEAAARFKVGLMQLRDSGELDALLQPKPWYRQQRFLATAASIAIVAIGLALWFNRGPAAQPLLVASSMSLLDRLGEPLPVASTHVILRTRSVSYDAEIELPKTPQTIALRVLPEVAAQPARYRITLSSIADDDTLHEVAAIGGLAPAEDGFVPVYLNGAKLTRGRYQLALSGDAGTSAADAVSVFLMKISDDPS
jgi:hypothetical protein